jgi:hypothetical protein
MGESPVPSVRLISSELTSGRNGPNDAKKKLSAEAKSKNITRQCIRIRDW